MPGKRRAARAYRHEKKPITDRDRAMQEIEANPWSYFRGVEHPAVAAFDLPERKQILAEVFQRRMVRRSHERRPMMLDRLRDWPASMWGSVFSEDPELEEELNPEQAAAWQAWRAEASRRKLRETQSNVVAMPPPEEPKVN